MSSDTLARDAVRPVALPPEKTLLDMLYYMKLTRELEFRIERKLYRQGKIVGGGCTLAGGKKQSRSGVASIFGRMTSCVRHTATWGLI